MAAFERVARVNTSALPSARTTRVRHSGHREYTLGWRGVYSCLSWCHMTFIKMAERSTNIVCLFLSVTFSFFQKIFSSVTFRLYFRFKYRLLVGNLKGYVYVAVWKSVKTRKTCTVAAKCRLLFFSNRRARTCSAFKSKHVCFLRMPITYLAFERRRPSVLRAHPTRAPESNRSNAAQMFWVGEEIRGCFVKLYNSTIISLYQYCTECTCISEGMPHVLTTRSLNSYWFSIINSY